MSCPLDPSLSSWPLFQCSLITLCASYLVAFKPAHSACSGATPAEQKWAIPSLAQPGAQDLMHTRVRLAFLAAEIRSLLSACDNTNPQVPFSRAALQPLVLQAVRTTRDALSAVQNLVFALVNAVDDYPFPLICQGFSAKPLYSLMV